MENELADVNFPENFQEIVKTQRFKGRKKSLLKKQIGYLKNKVKSELPAVEEEIKELRVAKLSQIVEHENSSNSLSLEIVQGVQAEIDRQSAHGVSGGNKSEMSLSLANCDEVQIEEGPQEHTGHALPGNLPVHQNLPAHLVENLPAELVENLPAQVVKHLPAHLVKN